MRSLIILAATLLASLAPAQRTCSSTLHAASCGPTLTVTFTPHASSGNTRMDITADGLHANALMAVAFSFDPQTVQLPAGCIAMAYPVWSELHMSGASGSFTWGRNLPHWATVLYYMQMGSIDALPGGGISILATDAMHAGCL